MIRVKEAIVVEGKYDKIKLSSLVDGIIVETNGFGIFQDREKMKYLRRLAEERGLLVLTDSDGAGFLIRSRISSCIPKSQVKHAYIPDIAGKERRKSAPSKEGKLGVEGMETAVLREALERAGATIGGAELLKSGREEKISKADLYALGLSGGEHSEEKRKALKKAFVLPERLSANGLLQALNALYSRKEFLEKMKAEEGSYEVDQEGAGGR